MQSIKEQVSRYRIVFKPRLYPNINCPIQQSLPISQIPVGNDESNVYPNTFPISQDQIQSNLDSYQNGQPLVSNFATNETISETFNQMNIQNNSVIVNSEHSEIEPSQNETVDGQDTTKNAKYQQGMLQRRNEYFEIVTKLNRQTLPALLEKIIEGKHNPENVEKLVQQIKNAIECEMDKADKLKPKRINKRK